MRSVTLWMYLKPKEVPLHSQSASMYFLKKQHHCITSNDLDQIQLSFQDIQENITATLLIY